MTLLRELRLHQTRRPEQPRNYALRDLQKMAVSHARVDTVAVTARNQFVANARQMGRSASGLNRRLRSSRDAKTTAPTTLISNPRILVRQL